MRADRASNLLLRQCPLKTSKDNLICNSRLPFQGLERSDRSPVQFGARWRSCSQRQQIGAEIVDSLARQIRCLAVKENVLDAGADSGFRRLPHAQPHRRRGLKSEQQALGVFGIANAVVQEVPVQAIGAGIARVATGATLPALEADGRVVEIEFTFADLISFGSWISGSGC
jgi:hypothetical protein